MTDSTETTNVTTSWTTIRERVLEKEGKAGPFLDIIEKHWKAGLPKDVAELYIASYFRGDYKKCWELMFSTATPDQVIQADKDENDRLKKMIESEKKVFNFLDDMKGVLLKIALGASLAAVGL